MINRMVRMGDIVVASNRRDFPGKYIVIDVKLGKYKNTRIMKVMTWPTLNVPWRYSSLYFNYPNDTKIVGRLTAGELTKWRLNNLIWDDVYSRLIDVIEN